jgi:hypothetical protein
LRTSTILANFHHPANFHYSCQLPSFLRTPSH